MRKKIVLAVALLAGLVLVGGVGFVLVKMGPRNVIGMLRYDQRHAGTLKVGDRAPDAALTALDGREPVRLADRWTAKPLVLVFGSYT